MDSEFAAMLSTAVSICGVSAAIAACGAIGGDRKKLSYVTSLVLIVAVPMMLIMPWAVEHFQIPAVIGGAWIGGTIDTTGAVVAAGVALRQDFLAKLAGQLIRPIEGVGYGRGGNTELRGHVFERQFASRANHHELP